MRIAKVLFLISPTLLALVLAAAHVLSKSEQAGEAEREAPIHKAFEIAILNGATTVNVDQLSQTRSGIQTAVLESAAIDSGPAVYGTVADVQPLIELSSRHAAGLAELHSAQAELAQKDAELQRVRTLYEDKQNTSQKALEAAQADAAAARAKVSVANAAVTAAAAAMQLQFGPGVAPSLAALMKHKAVLVRVVFPSPATTAPKRLTLSDGGQGSLEAQLVSASPQTDPGIQGQTYLYRVDAPLAVGMRLVLLAPGQPQAGVRIPPEAVVWYGGQPWAYVRITQTRFERRLIDQAVSAGGAFIAPKGFKNGEALVVRGSQLLLSEEGRALLSKD